MNRQELFNYMKNEHDVTLLETDMIEIERIVMKSFHAQFPTNLDTLIQRVEGLLYSFPQSKEEVYFNNALNKAIEILRSAPVEVCEWIIDVDFGGMGYPGCVSNQHIQIMKVDYKYCPFCGRKIKRV
jgi:hypothetical protein